MIRIYGDFNEMDEKGRVVLHDANDLRSEAVRLRGGMRVIVWQEETEIEGVLEFEEGLACPPRLNESSP